jgi:hypothetical protein
MRRYRSALSRGVCGWLVLLTPGMPASAQDATIKIIIQEGQGAINNIQQHRAKEPVVQVTDSGGAPIQGASVTFLLPDNGPSGSFADGAKMLTVQTDEKGQAVGRGLRPNEVTGSFQIRVTASYRGSTASAAISQVNATPASAKAGSGKKFLIIALIGGAAVGGLAAALGGKSGAASSSTPGSSPPGTVLVPGSPSIQPPH